MKLRRLFFGLFFLVSFYWFMPGTAFAQNTFSCIYIDPVNGCVVNTSTNTCQPSFEPDNGVCTSITEAGTCNGKINVACKATEAPEDCDEHWLWNSVSGSCQRICQPQEGAFDTYEECQANLGVTPSDTVTLRPQECQLNPKYDLGQLTYDTGVKTALGCIPYEPGPLVSWIFGVAISLGGGIAFLIMGVGAFLFITSQGNPEQLQKGKEMIVSAGAGLLFIIFSIFLLRLIGVDILKIPGFT